MFVFIRRRGRGRTQLSLLPRSLHRQSLPVNKVENGTAAEQAPPATSASASVAGDTKSLSNSDFAKMLLNK